MLTRCEVGSCQSVHIYFEQIRYLHSHCALAIDRELVVLWATTARWVFSALLPCCWHWWIRLQREANAERITQVSYHATSYGSRDIYRYLFADIVGHFLSPTTANIEFCGNGPMVTNPGTVRVSWSGDMFNVHRAYLEVRRVANIRGQLTGCLVTVEVASRHVSRSSLYPLPSVDYNSLYIAKVLWLDSSNNAHYRNNSECYFIPQRRECSHTPESM